MLVISALELHRSRRCDPDQHFSTKQNFNKSIKTMKILPKILVGSSLFASYLMGQQTIHVDLGAGNGATAGNFNTISTQTSALLIDDTGAATGITLDVQHNAYSGAGATYAGPYPTEVASQPASALGDSLFIRNSNNGNTALLVLSGLVASNTYDFLIYGARGNNGIESIYNVIDAGGEQSETIVNTFNNDSEVAVFENLVPDSNNEIVIEFTSSPSSSSGAAFNYLGITVSEAVDTDDDGMPDFYETANGLDINVDDTTLDKDMDGLSNEQEYLGQDATGIDTGYGQTKAGEPDSDGDGLDDGDEVSGAMNPWDEFGFMVTPPAVGAPTNPNEINSDTDSLTDFEELDGANGSVSDPNFEDTDFDGLLDDYEVSNNLDPTDANGDNGANGDPDSDNLTNADEEFYGTDPNDADTDDDTLLDEDEVLDGTDPLLADTDGDQLRDDVESDVNSTTDPLVADTDGDGFTDLMEVEGGSLPDDANSLPSFPNISWSVIDFSSGSLLSTDGSLLFAENYNGVTTTVNGITFEGVSATGPLRSSPNFLSTMDKDGLSADIYDDEDPELTELFEKFWWISGTTTSNVGVTGLTPGLTYQIQFGRSDDRGGASEDRYAFADGFEGDDATSPLGPNNTIYGGPDNPAILLTGTFVATSSVQVFSTGQKNLGSAIIAGTQMSFIQVREIPAIVASNFEVEEVRASAGTFEVDFSSLNVARSYQLVRSLDLEDSFPTIVDGPKTPAAASDTFVDNAAPADKAFYRLVELP